MSKSSPTAIFRLNNAGLEGVDERIDDRVWDIYDDTRRHTSNRCGKGLKA